jgi:uridine kinase
MMTRGPTLRQGPPWLTSPCDDTDLPQSSTVAASQTRARIIVLAGPSGSGKSRLASRLGLPVLRLDNFYRDGDDASLPRAFGIVDWDDPASWNHAAAVDAACTLAREGAADVPTYDIPTSRATGASRLEAGGAPLVVAEGIFAAEVIPDLRDAGVLADAICLTHPTLVTFTRRLTRDLREGRKPPVTLLRRGLSLLRDEPRIVAHQVALGAVPCSPARAADRVRALMCQASTV